MDQRIEFSLQGLVQGLQLVLDTQWWVVNQSDKTRVARLVLRIKRTQLESRRCEVVVASLPLKQFWSEKTRCFRIKSECKGICSCFRVSGLEGGIGLAQN